jgi:hypothetical protein
MNFGNKYFKKFNDVFTAEQHHEILTVFKRRGWSFDNWSLQEADKGILCWSFWGLESEPFFNTTLVSRIEELTGNTYRVDRIYGNGQSFGQDGVFHVDTDDSRAHTFLYYPTKLDIVDVYEYGGETQFLQDDGDMYHVYPFTNTAVMFDGRIWHRGMGPNKWTKELRMSLAFKLYLQ